jgi:tRNA U34 5-methylaminomethyl-2-thiouridine-forming methyltransferase MnmC
VKKELVLTHDGSNTLYVPEINETYHSIHGALQESMHVFIKRGLNYCERNQLELLEVGFGTGLNTLLTGINSSITHRTVRMYSLEAFPLEKEDYDLLKFTELDALKMHSNMFKKIIDAEWNVMNQITSNFSLQKIKIRVQDFHQTNKYDLIYFDAFAPDKQPELWTAEIFEKMYKALNPGGVLVTYCAKGNVKRIIKSVGFILQNIPGPPGKREMSRAIKP